MGSKTFVVDVFGLLLMFFFVFVIVLIFFVDVTIAVAVLQNGMESREVFRSGVQESVTRVTGRAA